MVGKPDLNSFRIMGRWWNGQDFLIVFGSSEYDCTSRFLGAMSIYNRAELELIEHLWLEFWVVGSRFGSSYWSEIKDISMFQIKFIATLREKNRARS